MNILLIQELDASQKMRTQRDVCVYNLDMFIKRECEVVTNDECENMNGGMKISQ
jgi:hypothetical protein